jgi:pSer/pThr/pTyr-binding forkhead associated (FHA) protein
LTHLTIEWHTDEVGDQITTIDDSQGAIIGRHPSCDIVLPYPYVFRRYAVIYYDDDTFHLQNLSDTNPTVYNDRWELETKLQVDLRPGDTFTIGLVRLRIPPFNGRGV